MAETGSYYGRPIVKPPVWKPDIPVYFFFGGLGGASSALALAARLAGNDRLARTAALTSAGALAVSPLLLIHDLGRPARFLNMLRVVKVTSPMSIGSWTLAAGGTMSGAAAACELLGILPRVRRATEVAAGLIGLPLSTYTGALVADTAIPAWHTGRRELPFLFAGGAAASAGGAAAIAAPFDASGPARRLALFGALLELTAARAMERRLGLLAEPYEKGTSGRLSKAGKACMLAGGALIAGARSRSTASAAGAVLCAGSLLVRFSVWKAGVASAEDPKYTVLWQRHGTA
jgi:polysulfide reductase-like protein